MRKSDLEYLKVGNTIKCKHNLGTGLVREVLLWPDEREIRGRYPMVCFRDNATGKDVWCTYLVIEPRRSQ